MAKIKISRKQLKKPDEFIAKSTKVIQYVAENQRNFGLLLGLVVVLFIGAILWREYSKGVEERSSAALFRAMNDYRSIDEGDKDINRLEEVMTSFKEIESRYKRTTSGIWSLYYIGLLKYRAGDLDAAIEYVSKFVSRVDNDFVKTLGLNTLGLFYEEKGDYKEVERIFSEISQKDTPTTPLSSYYKARAMRLEGDVSGARDEFEKAKEALSHSYFWKAKIQDELMLINTEWKMSEEPEEELESSEEPEEKGEIEGEGEGENELK